MDLESLRDFCNKLPACTEDIKWENNLCFSVGGKMFCIADMENPLNFSFKVTDEQFEELIQSPGFIPAPYLAKSKWVKANDMSKTSKKMLQELVYGSYELIKAKLPAKTRKALGI